ncbi:P-loop containing nucleoside triphosphate hydrolases superfamily protein [Wolffia australiana]
MAGVSRGGSLLRFVGAGGARRFGAAAAIQAEYDSEDDLELAFQDSCGERDGRSIQWVFMGSPSDRRRAYASRVAMLRGVPYISMGNLVRKELHPPSAVYKQISSAVNEGKLIPEDVIFALLSQRLEEGYARGERGFILDGIPRTRLQAEILDQIAQIDLVVNIKCREDCLANNRSGGGICSSCGTSDHAGVCKQSATNSFVQTRPQPSPLDVASRLDNGEAHYPLYTEQSKLLEDYYRRQRKLLDFHVSAGPRETWQRLLAALQLQHVDGVNSSPALTP